jgi:glyoxylase-like metal-dependent hydrolase (beta-lactamase superfamily II)
VAAEERGVRVVDVPAAQGVVGAGHPARFVRLLDRHPGVAQAVGVLDILVAQDVPLTHGDQRRCHPADGPLTNSLSARRRPYPSANSTCDRVLLRRSAGHPSRNCRASRGPPLRAQSVVVDHSVLRSGQGRHHEPDHAGVPGGLGGTFNHRQDPRHPRPGRHGCVLIIGMAGWEMVPHGAVAVLRADNGGAYPYGNSLVVRGSGGSLLVDPSLALDPAELPAVDAVVVSHAHEDHVAGLGGIDRPVHVHDADLAAVRSTQVLLDGYGLPPEATLDLERTVLGEFRVASRPDATGMADGHVFDLGDRRVTVVHLPGHTAGHCGLLVEPDGFLYIADIDLTSFGPYYGDLGSDLEQFERSMRICAEVEARWYGTFHQKGVIEGAAEFRSRLAAYRAVIERRDGALLEFLAEPRSLAEVAEHRLVYRPHVNGSHITTVETRTAEQHISRLVASGTVLEVGPRTYVIRGG